MEFFKQHTKLQTVNESSEKLHVVDVSMVHVFLLQSVFIHSQSLHPTNQICKMIR